MIFIGILVGLLIGVIVGFFFGVVGMAANEKKAAEAGIVKLDGKFYKLTEIDGGKV